MEQKLSSIYLWLAGMGGQGVLAIPNVYNGWIQQTVDTCGNHEDPCSDEVVKFLKKLTPSQKDPTGNHEDHKDKDHKDNKD